MSFPSLGKGSVWFSWGFELKSAFEQITVFIIHMCNRRTSLSSYSEMCAESSDMFDYVKITHVFQTMTSLVQVKGFQKL